MSNGHPPMPAKEHTLWHLNHRHPIVHPLPERYICVGAGQAVFGAGVYDKDAVMWAVAMAVALSPEQA